MILEDIAERSAEYAPWSPGPRGLRLPFQWLFPVPRARDLAISLRSPQLLAPSLGLPLGVAVSTARRDLSTSQPGVKSRCAPGNACHLAHHSATTKNTTPG